MLSAVLLLESLSRPSSGKKVPQADEVKSNKQKILLFLLLEENVPQADEVKSKAE
jgi:hypothetical protein